MLNSDDELVSISPFIAISIILTAYNEEEALPKLVNEIKEQMWEWPRLELIIVNDGSVDHTKNVMEELAQLSFEPDPSSLQQDSLKTSGMSWTLKLIHLENNQGMGAALQAGYRVASHPWVTFLPADGQIAPNMIGKLCKLVEPKTQLVTSRYTNREYTFYRKLLSKGLRLISYLILWVNITSEGNYLIKRTYLQQMELISDSFMLNLEIPIRIAYQGVHIPVANIEVRERQGGQSHATQFQKIIHTLKDLILLRYYLIKEKWSN